jgi:uncharacterized protein
MSAASLKANEPSMEEILASIRRIIADDSGVPPLPPGEPEPAAEPEDLDVLDLATVPDTATPLIKPVDLEPLPQSVEMDEDIEFRMIADPLEPPPPPPPPRMEQPVAPPPALEDSLLSPEIGASVATAFQALASTLVPQNGRTLEDLVKDMMRPMLKGWLDAHLPGLVERLVKAEIERIARGGH